MSILEPTLLSQLFAHPLFCPSSDPRCLPGVHGTTVGSAGGTECGTEGQRDPAPGAEVGQCKCAGSTFPDSITEVHKYATRVPQECHESLANLVFY